MHYTDYTDPKSRGTQSSQRQKSLTFTFHFHLSKELKSGLGVGRSSCYVLVTTGRKNSLGLSWCLGAGTDASRHSAGSQLHSAFLTQGRKERQLKEEPGQGLHPCVGREPLPWGPINIFLHPEEEATGCLLLPHCAWLSHGYSLPFLTLAITR